MTDRVFHIKWDTGFMDVNISTFFVEANAAKVKKLYRLARQYCTEEERQYLLDALSQEDKERERLLDALSQEDKERERLLDALRELSRMKSKLANDFYQMKLAPEEGWAEKQLVKDRARLAKAISLLTEERWF